MENIEKKDSKSSAVSEVAHRYANIISGAWWLAAMQKWNQLSDEEQAKYNQFIGFNDFSDTLLNSIIDAFKKGYELGYKLKDEQSPNNLSN